MEIRRLVRGEEEQAIQLADEIFRDSEQKSMGSGFPSIFSSHLIHQSYGAFDNQQLVSFLGLVPSTVRIGRSSVNVYSLGSVCTGPDYRGKGIAGEILEGIMKDLKSTDASLLLVSGNRSLYTRVGCHPFGKVSRFTIKGSKAANNPNLVIREMETTDIHAMVRLAEQREVAYEQSVQELSLLLQAEAYASCIKRSHRVLVAEEDGQLKGFLIVGVPYDQEKQDGLAIEWAGEAKIVAELARQALVHFGLKSMNIKVSWHEQALSQELDPYDSVEERNLGTVYIVDPAKLVAQLSPYLSDAYNVQKIEAESEENGNIRLTINDESKVLAYNEFVAKLFDPESDPTDAKDNVTIPFPYTAGLNYI